MANLTIVTTDTVQASESSTVVFGKADAVEHLSLVLPAALSFSVVIPSIIILNMVIE